MNLSFCWSANMAHHYAGVLTRKVTKEFILTSTALHVLFGFLKWFVTWKVSSHRAAVFWSVSCRICSRQHEAFWSNFHLAFYTSIFFVSICCIDTATTWKKSSFILSKKSDFYITDSQLIAFHTFARPTLTSLSVDKMLQLRYVNRATNFRGLFFTVGISPFHLKIHVLYFICIHIEDNASCCFFYALQ